MSWINLVSHRYTLVGDLEKRIVEWGKEPLNGPGTIGPAILALISGNQHLIDKSVQISSKWLNYFLIEKPRVGYHSHLLLSNYVNFILLTSLNDGLDLSKRSLLEDLVYAKPIDNKQIVALQAVVKQLLTGIFKQEKTKRNNGFTLQEIEFNKKSGNMLPEHLFNICSSIDHPYWITCFINYLLPSTFMLQAQNSENKYCVKDYFAYGAHPLYHMDKVVYERKTKAPGLNTLYHPEREETWWGFDAVELTENGVCVYNWLGFNWEAALLFIINTKANAFMMYDSIKENWMLFKQHVTPAIFEKTQSEIQKHGCKYKFVYNSRLALPLPEHLKKAQDFYGIDIELVEMMDL